MDYASGRIRDTMNRPVTLIEIRSPDCRLLARRRRPTEDRSIGRYDADRIEHVHQRDRRRWP
jgi:hypothetical protein